MFQGEDSIPEGRHRKSQLTMKGDDTRPKNPPNQEKDGTDLLHRVSTTAILSLINYHQLEEAWDQEFGRLQYQAHQQRHARHGQCVLVPCRGEPVGDASEHKDEGREFDVEEGV